MTARLDESLHEGSLRGSSGLARRSLESLRTAPGYVVLEGPDAAPTLVRIRPMRTSHWRRLGGGGGAGALYELVPSQPVLIIAGDREFLAGGES